jgi:uncharacterized protein (TIGR03066 family)
MLSTTLGRENQAPVHGRHRALFRGVRRPRIGVGFQAGRAPLGNGLRPFRDLLLEQSMRKIFTLAVVACAVLTLSGCAGPVNPKEAIIGKWHVAQPAGIVMIEGTTEFRKNGAMTTEMGKMKIDGKYHFIDDETIAVEFRMGGRDVYEKNKIVSMTKDEMVLKDPDGVKAEFTRIK